MLAKKTIRVTDSDSYEVACGIATIAGFPIGSKCWEFGKVWTKRSTEMYNEAEPDIGGVYVWHLENVCKCGEPGDCNNIAYIIEEQADIRVDRTGLSMYDVTFSQRVPLECVDGVSDESIKTALEAMKW